MALSINYRLEQLANKYYIKAGSIEAKKIYASVDNLKRNLKTHFNTDIKQVIEFGSYRRDTILPREFDSNSDVDLLISFNHASLQVTPGTYRNYLLKFAEKYYKRSEVYKSSPTIVLELNNIKYDLVPCYEESYFFSSTPTAFYIPESDSKWITTDPGGFNQRLAEKNKQHNFEIKRVIRLLKSWNAKVGYPINSYKLEQQIVDMIFFFCITLEDFFFAAINDLQSNQGGFTYLPNPKIQALKDNAKRVREYLSQDKMDGAVTWLAHILPM